MHIFIYTFTITCLVLNASSTISTVMYVSHILRLNLLFTELYISIPPGNDFVQICLYDQSQMVDITCIKYHG